MNRGGSVQPSPNRPRPATPDQRGRLAAHLSGGVELFLKTLRLVLRLVDEFRLNLRYAFRSLGRTPFLTLFAVLSLSLGVGANTAVFSMFNLALRRPLQVPAPERLVNVSSPGPKGDGATSTGASGGAEDVFSYPLARDLERLELPLAGLAAHRPFTASVATRGAARILPGLLVSGGYFQTLGLKPAVGRLFLPEDDGPAGGSDVVVLSHSFWRTAFNASPAILNHSLVVNDRPMAIAGVTERGFDGTTLGRPVDVFVPLSMSAVMIPDWNGLNDRSDHSLYLFARLGPGVSREQAETAINVPFASIVTNIEAPLHTFGTNTAREQFRSRRVELHAGEGGQTVVRGQLRRPLTLLLGATGIVLLVACGNIANLLLARAFGRIGEMSIRLSIGASRLRLVRQQLVEVAVLAVIGGSGGLLVARWVLRGLRTQFPPEMGEFLAFELDGSTLLFVSAAASVTAIVFGLYPALRGTRLRLRSAMNGASGRFEGGWRTARVRMWLVTTQVALSIALLVLAALFAKSLANASRLDLGLEVEQLTTFRVSPQLSGYEGERALVLLDQITDGLLALPGVTGATQSMVQLISSDNWGTNVTVEGFDNSSGADATTQYNRIGTHYFRTLGIPLLAGREFLPTDNSSSPTVAIVNEAFSRKFGLAQQTVGRRMHLGRRNTLDIEIVGLVRDAAYSEVKDDIPPQLFLPSRQEASARPVSFYVRSVIPPARLMAAIPQVVVSIDPLLPVAGLQPMTQQVSENLSLDRLVTILSVSVASLAVLLASSVSET